MLLTHGIRNYVPGIEMGMSGIVLFLCYRNTTMIYTDFSVSASETFHMSWSYGPSFLQTHICLAYLNSLFLRFSSPSQHLQPCLCCHMKVEFPEIKTVPQEKGTATTNWHIWAISKVSSRNFAAFNTAPWSSPESTSTNSCPWEKMTKELGDLPAHTFFILNHLFKFIRAPASSFVNSSLSTEGQTKLIKDLKTWNFKALKLKV